MLAGTTRLLLSHASQNLGDPRSAMAQIRTAWTCAEQVDHTGLRAWARGTAALITDSSPQNCMALKLTDHGAALTPAGESRIRIAAIEARTAARLGDRERALAAIARLTDAREQMSERDEVEEFGGLLRLPTAKQEYLHQRVGLRPGHGRREEDRGQEAVHRDRHHRTPTRGAGHRGQRAGLDCRTHLLDQVVPGHPGVRKVWVDGGYRQHLVKHAATLGIDMEIVARTPWSSGFTPIPKRWAVERTYGSLMLHRRLAHDYETLRPAPRP